MYLDFTYLEEVQRSKKSPLNPQKLDEQILKFEQFKESRPFNYFTSTLPHSVIRNFCFGIVDLIMFHKSLNLKTTLQLLDWDYQHYFAVKTWVIFKVPSIQSMILRLRFMKDYKLFFLTNEVIRSWIKELINQEDLKKQCLEFF